jgi:glycosyltransferase involved in cell wall biosynthesis
VVDLANELSKNNQVSLYTLRDDTIENKGFYIPEISKRVTYQNLKISPGFKLSLILLFFKILRKEKPDVVHCHLNLVLYFFPLSLIFFRRIRFIYTIHNSAETEVESETERKIRRFFFKSKLFIPVAISDETKRSYLDYFNLKHVETIYNGRTAVEKTRNFENVLSEVESLKKTDNTLVFVHLARFDEIQKNHTLLVSVFNRLIKTGYDVILLMIGEGFERATELRKLATDGIHFLGVKSNATDYLFVSDGFCLSSNFEGMPISMIEAFACGCFPICTPVGGCVNSIIHGKTGFLSESNSEEDYFNAVNQFIKLKDTLNRNDLPKIFHDRFGIDKCVESYIKLYTR